MSAYWQQHWYGAASFLFVLVVLTFATVSSEGKLPASFAGVPGGASGVVEKQSFEDDKNPAIQKPANHFVDQDQSDRLGYTIERRLRKVPLESGDGSKAIWIDMEYIRLRKNKRLVKTFDAGLYFGAGNSADFGFFPFLNNGSEQLFVSQDIYRGGNQWVANLVPKFKVIFDGDDWAVGREAWDLEAVDLDKDGSYEIIAPTCIFYGFANLSPGGTPLTRIVFKYSKTSRRYLPANPQFSDYLLARAEHIKSQISPTGDPIDDLNHLSDVLDIVLDYVFTGRQKEAWTFFDQAYKLPDKNKVKTEVQSVLNSSPVYRFIYRRKIQRSRV